MATRRPGEHGFTIVEVVVGFTIIALAAAALSAVLGGGLRAAELAGRDAARIALAQDVLAEAASTGRPVSRRAGDLEAAAELVPEPGLAPRAGLSLVRVTVRVSDAGGPVLELATQRLLPTGAGP